MTSIVNFERKLNDRMSNVILDSLNRMNDAKLSGAMSPDEFSKIIVLVGNLFANKIKQGKVESDQVDSFESFLTGFMGPNKDKYFDYPHIDLDKATNMVLQGNSFALSELERRKEFSNPVIQEEKYTAGFKRL